MPRRRLIRQEKIMAEKQTHLTITLTGRRPAKIALAEWPILAEGSAKDWDNQYEFQANRRSDLKIKVRQHADGRAIVYGIYDHDTQFQSESGKTVRAGRLLDAGADIPAAITVLADEMAERIGDDPFGLDVHEVAHQCIADLPAEQI